MSDRKFRLLLIVSHPIQYAVPIFRLMAQRPELEILVAYCSLHGIEGEVDPEFGIEVAWDIPLLDGYPWIQLKNWSSRPGIGSFWNLINLDLWDIIRNQNFDVVISYLGYAYASFWIAAIAAKIERTTLLFGTDAHELNPRDKQWWKVHLKRKILPHIFRLANKVIVPSTGSVNFIHSLGISREHIALTPYVVDNEWWQSQAARVDRWKVREHWGVAKNSIILLFCAKLQPWKAPHDALKAFAQANIDESYLIFAGDGPLRAELENEAKVLDLSDRVKFLGFVNQSQLPSVYSACDLLVLPSEYEPFGVVVNEAMLCHCPAIVSDRVGAQYDLVDNGVTGFIYPYGDVNSLATILRDVMTAPGQLEQIKKNAYERIQVWSPEVSINALISTFS